MTGVRFSAAARMTARPTGVEPVNSRWSNGSAEKVRATSGSPFTTHTSSRANDFADERRQQRTGRGRELRHLDHCPVAGGERADERAGGQVDRVVPGHDDAHDAERLGEDAARDPAETRARRRAVLGFIQRRRWRRASLTPSRLGKISSSRVS